MHRISTARSLITSAAAVLIRVFGRRLSSPRGMEADDEDDTPPFPQGPRHHGRRARDRRSHFGGVTGGGGTARAERVADDPSRWARSRKSRQERDGSGSANRAPDDRGRGAGL